MPRDIFPGDLILTASPEAKTPRPPAFSEQDASINQFLNNNHDDSDKDLQRSDKLRESDENLHPYVQILSISDLESCVALENAAFPESERCSREKASPFIVQWLVDREKIIEVACAVLLCIISLQISSVPSNILNVSFSYNS